MKLEEKLLEAWVRLSSCIWNRRLVNGMSYNEALVLSLLYKQKNMGKHCTATELCEQMNLLKSQMNRTLCQMEEKGLIGRMRSSEDKRNVFIMLTDKGQQAYFKEHGEIIEIVTRVVSRLGEEKTRQVTEIFNEVTDAFKDADVERK